jgi:hypothetical protein
MKFFEAMAAWLVRFRWLVIACWVVALAAAWVALPSLGSEVNSDPTLFLSGSARSVAAANLGTSLLGTRSTSKVTIVAATSGSKLTSADVAAIGREARLAQQVSGVQSVRYVAESPGGDAVQLTATVNRGTSDAAGLKPVIAALQVIGPAAGPAAAPGRAGGHQRREQRQREQGQEPDRSPLGTGSARNCMRAPASGKQWPAPSHGSASRSPPRRER